MGCNGSKEEVDPAQLAANKAIEDQLKKDKQTNSREVKLLLLGAGESGKSTIAKQLKIIHLDGFNEKERATYRSIIALNVIGSMRVLINAAKNLGEAISAENQPLAEQIAKIDDEYFSGQLTPAIGKDIAALWKDPGIQNTFARANEFQLYDSAKYFFDEIDKISSESFVPSEQDVLRSRVKTTGIIETEFVINGHKFRLVDVGGQRSERKKWMHCFTDVTAVIFVVAMSEYDLRLYEDQDTNRMHESLRLFKEICNMQWFVKTAMILFLNKRDLFADKIARVPLTVCFPEYPPANREYEPAAAFIREKFESQRENPQKPIYTQFTCATDTNNIKFVFDAVRDIVLQAALEQIGLGPQ